MLDKNNMSRYKMRMLLDWNYTRVNDYYFNRVKDIKREEIIALCDLFNCTVGDLFVYKKSKKK